MSFSLLSKSLNKQAGTVRVLQLLETGIPFSVIEKIADYLDISVNELMNHLRVSRSTWHRRKKAGKLDFSLSDKVYQLSKLLEYAEGIFGGSEKVKTWFNLPAIVFENRRPLELIGSLSGLNLINDELIRIEQGVYI